MTLLKITNLPARDATGGFGFGPAVGVGYESGCSTDIKTSAKSVMLP